MFLNYYAYCIYTNTNEWLRKRSPTPFEKVVPSTGIPTPEVGLGDSRKEERMKTRSETKNRGWYLGVDKRQIRGIEGDATKSRVCNVLFRTDGVILFSRQRLNLHVTREITWTPDVRGCDSVQGESYESISMIRSFRTLLVRSTDRCWVPESP